VNRDDLSDTDRDALDHHAGWCSCLARGILDAQTVPPSDLLNLLVTEDNDYDRGWNAGVFAAIHRSGPSSTGTGTLR
jgi:hypothetical protein